MKLHICYGHLQTNGLQHSVHFVKFSLICGRNDKMVSSFHDWGATTFMHFIGNIYLKTVSESSFCPNIKFSFSDGILGFSSLLLSTLELIHSNFPSIQLGPLWPSFGQRNIRGALFCSWGGVKEGQGAALPPLLQSVVLKTSWSHSLGAGLTTSRLLLGEGKNSCISGASVISRFQTPAANLISNDTSRR